MIIMLNFIKGKFGFFITLIIVSQIFLILAILISIIYIKVEIYNLVIFISIYQTFFLNIKWIYELITKKSSIRFTIKLSKKSKFFKEFNEISGYLYHHYILDPSIILLDSSPRGNLIIFIPVLGSGLLDKINSIEIICRSTISIIDKTQMSALCEIPLEDWKNKIHNLIHIGNYRMPDRGYYRSYDEITNKINNIYKNKFLFVDAKFKEELIKPNQEFILILGTKDYEYTDVFDMIPIRFEISLDIKINGVPSEVININSVNLIPLNTIEGIY